MIVKKLVVLTLNLNSISNRFKLLVLGLFTQIYERNQHCLQLKMYDTSRSRIINISDT